VKTITLAASAPDSLDRALAILRRGGLIAFPTDTVYGLGALAFDSQAVKGLYLAKGRKAEKAIPILLGDATDLGSVASRVPDMARRLADRYWPGPLTLLVPKIASLPDDISSGATVGVRQPNHPIALALLRAAGPLAVTSANVSGMSSPLTAEDVRAQLDGRLDLILDGGTAPGGVPSSVVDCTGSQPVVLRAGPISIQDLQSALV
jgi:L-threonylcarbamoyladenylate synthase